MSRIGRMPITVPAGVEVTVAEGNVITVSGDGEARGWTLCLRNIPQVAGVQGGTQTGSEWGVVVSAEGNTLTITL